MSYMPSGYDNETGQPRTPPPGKGRPTGNKDKRMFTIDKELSEKLDNLPIPKGKKKANASEFVNDAIREKFDRQPEKPNEDPKNTDPQTT